MGLLELLGLRAKGGVHHLVVATYEGPNRLRLNGNRTLGPRGKRGAVDHSRTVCWIEFTPDGTRVDQGTGPAAGKLGPAAVEKLLRDLPLDPACKSVLHALVEGREQTSKIIGFEKWGHFGFGQEEAEPHP